MKQSTTKYIDYLTEDTPIPGQLWCCISFLSPEGIKNCSLRGLKIRGVYGTRQEADNKAEELQKNDPDFHVFVGEVGKWLPWDPEPNDVENNVYHEKELNDLMKGYKEQQLKAKQMEKTRKEEMIKNAAIEEQAKNKSKENGQTKERLKKELERRKQNDKINSTLDTLQEKDYQLTDKENELNEIHKKLKQEDELAKSEKQRLTDANNEIKSTTQNLETIDSKLAKIQELYEKLNKKNETK